MSDALLPYALACQFTYSGAMPTFEDAARLTHVYTSNVEGRLCFAFEGTEQTLEWVYRDFMVINPETVNHPEFGIVHGGIAKGAWGVCDNIESYLAAAGNPPYSITGHSKGAGEAWLAAAEMKRRGRPPAFVAAFEGPHVGLRRLQTYCADIVGIETATINSHSRDIVTCFPLMWPSVKEPRVILPVPDSYDVPTKHRIAGVIYGLQAAAVVAANTAA